MPRRERLLWDAETLAASLPRHRLADLDDARAHRSWLEDLSRWGVTLVTDVAPDRDGLAAIAGRIGIMESNNYGIDWEIVTTDEPFNQVDGDVPLRVHSDLPYRRLPPGIQILLAAEADAGGGDTLLVDGYRVASDLREADPAAWAVLTTVARAFSYVREDQRYIGGGPVIGLDGSGEPEVIRHAPDLVLPLREDDPAAADRALAAFIDAAAAPRYLHRTRLEPGQAVVIDNHRVLHGRGPVDLSTGGRRLLGCYVGVDEFESALRVARRSSTS